VRKKCWVDLWLSPLLGKKGVKLLVIKFIDYAIIWCDQLILSMRRNNETYWHLRWDEGNHEKEICFRILLSGFIYKVVKFDSRAKSVEDYHEKMKVAMIWENIVEDMEAIMIRFMNGLHTT
jgi:hypothetical protein